MLLNFSHSTPSNRRFVAFVVFLFYYNISVTHNCSSRKDWNEKSRSDSSTAKLFLFLVSHTLLCVCLWLLLIVQIRNQRQWFQMWPWNWQSRDKCKKVSTENRFQLYRTPQRNIFKNKKGKKIHLSNVKRKFCALRKQIVEKVYLYTKITVFSHSHKWIILA